MGQKEVEFSPDQWLQGIGDFCLSCKQRLETDDCISLCKCYLFCHEHCFLREFSPHIFDNQKVICSRCQEEVKFQFSYITKWECNKRPVIVGLLILVSLILLALLIVVATGVFRSILSDGAGYAIFAVGLLLLVGAGLFSMRKKYIDIDKLRIKNTNLLNSPETDAAMKSMDYQNDLKKHTKGDPTEKALDFDIQ